MGLSYLDAYYYKLLLEVGFIEDVNNWITSIAENNDYLEGRYILSKVYINRIKLKVKKRRVHLRTLLFSILSCQIKNILIFSITGIKKQLCILGYATSEIFLTTIRKQFLILKK